MKTQLSDKTLNVTSTKDICILMEQISQSLVKEYRNFELEGTLQMKLMTLKDFRDSIKISKISDHPPPKYFR